MNQMKAVIEGMLFLSGDEGIDIHKLIEVLGVSKEEFDQALEELKQDYYSESRGIRIEHIEDQLKLVTKKEHKDYYEKYFSFDIDTTLSTSALEVLAIVAYNEPITRMEIDEIRGVDSSYQVRKLLSKKLIESKGKSELPGKPNQYGITNTFLEYFGLSSKEDLPKIEMNESVEDVDLYESKKIAF